MKLFRFAFVFLILSAIAPLSFAQTGAYDLKVDDGIPQDVRLDVHAICDKLFQSMKDDKPLVMINMFVEMGNNSPENERNIKGIYEKLGMLPKNTNFYAIHEYLINPKSSGLFDVTLPAENGENFIAQIDGGKGPVYMYLLKSSGVSEEYCLCFIFTKTKGRWHLFSFHFGTYKIGMKTPIDWYKESKILYNKGWEIPAMQRLKVTERFLRPAPFLKYEKENEIIEFAEKLRDRLVKLYHFPMKVTWVKGSPMIYGLDYQIDQNEVIPVVIYVTKYALDMAVSIQDETNAINAKIEKLMPGIVKASKRMGYRAYPEPPTDPTKKYRYRELISTVK